MDYFKVLNDNTFIGIGTSYDLRVWQSKNKVMLIADINDAEYIQINDNLYHDDWMRIPQNKNYDFENVKVVTIDYEEYSIIYDSIDRGEEIEIQVDDEEPVENPVVPEPDITLEYVQNNKVLELSKICNRTIEHGFDMALDDNNIHHFSLYEQDQLNLITLSTQLAAGLESIPYHADGELCRFFSVNEVSNLLQKATDFKTYHVTYYNALKYYVYSLDTIEEVNNIYYGIYIPEEYQSDVMKYFLNNES